MTACPKGRLMVSPALLKEFKADFETARASCRTAEAYIEAEDAHAKSGAAMRRTSKAAVECGTALKRMHDSESYRDSYGNWAELCRALKLPRTVSYRLMACAESLSKVPPSTIGKIHTPLSIAPEGVDDEPDEAEPESTAGADRFAKLRETLRTAPRTEFDEAEVPKQANKPPEHDIAWVERQVAGLLRWFESRQLGTEAANHIEALLELASQAKTA